MRKGVAGVRLCDTSGCYSSWPCERHGTLKAGAEQWVNDHPIAGLIVPDLGVAPDAVPAKCCGYLLCNCPVPEPAQKLDVEVLPDFRRSGQI